jgi:hypothetical protein
VKRIAALLLVIVCATPIGAHIGSPDVFLEGMAGEYRLLVTVRPPTAIPGVADVAVRATSDDLRDVRIVSLPIAGAGAKFAPVADRAVRSSDDPRMFTGHLWLMGAGGWQVRVTVNGDRGEGMLSVPVPALPQTTLAMPATKAGSSWPWGSNCGTGLMSSWVRVTTSATASTTAPTSKDPMSRMMTTVKSV